MTEISVVIPVYRCAGCLEQLHERLRASLAEVPGTHEIVFVDDRSPDDAWAKLVELARGDPTVRAVRLSRNFGQHPAITAGLAASTGRWVAVIDCDLQEPPEQIPRLYAKAQEGYDIVLTRRVGTRHGAFRRLASRAYFRLARALLNVDIKSGEGALSLVSRKVVTSFLQMGDRDRHYLLILHWLGFHRAMVEIPHEQRAAGSSSYSLGQLIRVALDGIFFQTTTLLRLIIYSGFLIAGLGLLLAAAVIVFFITSNPLPGWTSLIVLLLALSGFIIISLGVTGLYVGRIFEQVKDRPLFIVDEEISGEDEPVAGVGESAHPAHTA